MKTQCTPVKHAALAAALLGIAPALVAESSMDTRDHDARSTDATTPAYSKPTSADARTRAALNDARGRSVSDLLGQDVYGTGNEDLGEIKDFIVDTQSGKITYAVVSSGGILGINQSLRAVPIDALRVSGDRMNIDLEQSRWTQAPVFTKDQLASLGQDARRKELQEFYGQRESRFGFRDGQLTLVSELRGKDVRMGDKEVGEIEDVIVQMQSRTVAALLDPDDDYAGTDREFLVPLKKLTNYDQDNLSTTLSREDFAQADRTYAASDTRSTDIGDTLQAWGAAAGSAIQSGSARVADAAENAGDRLKNATRTNQGQPPVDAIRRAVQADARAAGVQSTVNVVAAQDKVILRGTVPSEDVKERIEERAESVAQGWDVESELRVASTNP